MATTTPHDPTSPEPSPRRFLKRVTALGAAMVAGALDKFGLIRQSGGSVSANLPLRFTYCVPCKESSIAGPSRFTVAPGAGAGAALALGAPFSGKLMVRTSARLSCILP